MKTCALARRALWKALPGALVPFLLSAACACIGYVVLFGTFRFYDDEGYFLISLKNFAAGGGLYDQVYSQYGPFYFQVNRLLFFLLGLEFTHQASRLVVLLLWIATSLSLGLAVRRITRSLPLGAATQMLSFAVLSVLADEPLHPGGLICLSLSLIFLLSTAVDGERRARRVLPLLGALSGAVLLIKINLGVFVLLSLSLALLTYSPGSRTNRILRAGLCAVLPVLPLVLMRQLLHMDWALQYALLISISLVPVAVVLAGLSPRALIPAGALISALVGFLALSAASIAGALLSGTSFHGLLQGVLLGPLEHPMVFAVPLAAPAAPLLWCLLSLALFCAHSLWSRGARRVPLLPPPLLGALRFTASLAIAATAAGLLPLDLFYFSFPCLWLWIVPDEPGKPPDFPRVLLVLLAALQSLHAFPVAGSQVAFSTFLLVPAAFLGMWDGAGLLLARSGSSRSRLRPALGLAACLLALCSGLYRDFPSMHASRYAEGIELGLPGTAGIRLGERQVAVYRWLALNLSLHADTFISMPGLNSLYLWTRLTPPTLLNATSWMVLFDEGSQRLIAGRLSLHPEACAIVDRATVAPWLAKQDLGSLPLASFILNEFERAGSACGYDFLVRKGRRVELQLSAHLRGGLDREEPAIDLSIPPLPSRKLGRILVVDPEGGEVAWDSERSGRPVRILRLEGASPSEGTIDGQEELRDGSLPLDLSSGSRLRIPGMPKTFSGPPGRYLVRLLDPAFETIASLPILE